MPKFKYTTRNSAGERQQGIIETSDQKAATNILHDKGLIVIDLKPYVDNSLSALLAKVRKVSSKDLAVLTRQLSTMVGAGLNLVEALTVLENQTSNVLLKAMLEEIVKDVQGGNTFSRALARHPQVFSTVYINIVKAGEASGNLDNVLAKLADTLEKQDEFEKKVKGALVYPAIVLVAMAVVVVIMNVFVIPKISVVFAEQGASLPLPTKIVLFMSGFFVQYWILLLIALVGGAIGLRVYTNTPAGQAALSAVLINMPVIGNLISQASLTTFTRIFAILVGAGVTIIDALKIGAAVTENYQFKKALLEVASAVEKGSSISAPIARQKIFPPIVGQMVAVGEETGKIDEVLEKLSRYFESETEAAVKALTTAIEPVVIIMLGMMVGFLVIAVILPLYSLTDQFAR